MARKPGRWSVVEPDSGASAEGPTGSVPTLSNPQLMVFSGQKNLKQMIVFRGAFFYNFRVSERGLKGLVMGGFYG
jgi:hypothetical protein